MNKLHRILIPTCICIQFVALFGTALAEQRTPYKNRAYPNQTQPNQSYAAPRKTYSTAEQLELYKQQMSDALNMNWHLSSALEPGSSCVIHLKLIPSGDIVDFKINQCTGGLEFQQSVKIAVEEAARLPVPSDPYLFKLMQKTSIVFKPQIVEQNYATPPINTMKTNVNKNPTATPKIESPVVAPKMDLTMAKTQVEAPQVDPLTEREILILMYEFSNSYENGDLARFLNLFDKNVTGKDINSIETLRKDYADLFSATDERKFDISHLAWEKQQNKATGKGEFRINIKHKGQQEVKTYTGQLTLQLIKDLSGIRITQIDH